MLTKILREIQKLINYPTTKILIDIYFIITKIIITTEYTHELTLQIPDYTLTT